MVFHIRHSRNFSKLLSGVTAGRALFGCLQFSLLLGLGCKHEFAKNSGDSSAKTTGEEDIRVVFDGCDRDPGNFVNGKPYSEYARLPNGKAKADALYAAHLNSASASWNTWGGTGNFNPEDTTQMKAYAKKFAEKTHESLTIPAMLATARFLGPTFGQENLGWKSLASTQGRKCDTFADVNLDNVKKVHALNTVARVQFRINQDLSNKYLAGEFKGLTEIDGILSFSIANPVIPMFDGDKGIAEEFASADTVEQISATMKNSTKKFRLLEFIPGLGLKFFDKKGASFSFVAMESLAGQDIDQNYFKYSFSPDFSDHAPGIENTDDNKARKNAMLARYAENPANAAVMSLVGKRFRQFFDMGAPSIAASGAGATSFGKIQDDGPFRISTAGYFTEEHQLYKLRFKPSRNFLSADEARIADATIYPTSAAQARSTDHAELERYGAAASSTQSTHTLGADLNNDFRTKLANLRAGDTVYEVWAELSRLDFRPLVDPATGKKDVSQPREVKLGELVLLNTPFPSEFGSRRLFFKHELAPKR